MTYISRIIANGEKSARLCQLTIEKKVLTTPTYFPAISGAKSRFSFDELFKFLSTNEYPRMLISSYDFSKLDEKNKVAIASAIISYMDKGNFLFLDSGGYESFWLRDLNWNFELYKEVVMKINTDFYTNYDYSPDTTNNVTKFDEAYRLIKLSENLSENGRFIPIIHGDTPENVLKNLNTFLAKKEVSSQIIAIPERDCGVLLSERAETVLNVRKILNEYDDKTLLHLLGCGHPISMAVYSYCGADSFDSIDWMRIFINRDTYGINSHSNSELIHCKCAACMRDLDPYTKIFLHNLIFYQDYILQIQKMIKRNTLKNFLIQNIGIDFVYDIDKRVKL